MCGGGGNQTGKVRCSVSKHTQGPLTAGFDMPECVNNDPRPYLIWSGSKFIGSADSPWVGYGERVANAKLWAAAPELLAACQAMLEATGKCGYDCTQRKVWDAAGLAQAAIEKATGGAA